jgi:proteasome lid subunit RPN8/RPN11
MKLIVEQNGFASYRKRALAEYPMEYLEILVGTAADDVVEIKKFVHISHTVTKTNGSCPACGNQDVPRLGYARDDLDRIKKEAEAEGLQFLGTIHSHPDCDAIPSEADNDDSRSINEVVSGILHIWMTSSKRKRSHAQWWPPQWSVTDVRYKTNASKTPDSRESATNFRSIEGPQQTLLARAEEDSVRKAEGSDGFNGDPPKNV